MTVYISENYAELGDPYKLLDMACCDHCADVRCWRMALEHKIGKTCARMFATWHKIDDAHREAFREEIEELTQDYARMIAKTNFMDGMLWEEPIVSAIILDPRSWPDVLRRMWTSFNDRMEHV